MISLFTYSLIKNKDQQVDVLMEVFACGIYVVYTKRLKKYYKIKLLSTSIMSFPWWLGSSIFVWAVNGKDNLKERLKHEWLWGNVGNVCSYVVLVLYLSLSLSLSLSLYMSLWIIANLRIRKLLGLSYPKYSTCRPTKPCDKKDIKDLNNGQIVTFISKANLPLNCQPKNTA